VPQAVVGQVGLHVLLGLGYAYFLIRKPAAVARAA
jgi:hypothetical protein